jgi:Lon protease-like protein
MPPLELPIFALGIVLFPGTPRLLHVFEPRYRQMLADCLGGSRRFGVSYVAEEPGADPAPRPGAVGCQAVVQESRLLPDGRSNILAVGETRYVLLEYLSTGVPYRVARVEPFDDEDVDAPQQAEAAGEVRSLFARFAHGMQVLSGQSGGPLDLPRDPKQLSFQLSAALELDAAVKLELLGLRSTMQRLTHLIRILRPLNDELERRVAVHARARTNGRGGAKQDLVTGS